MDKPGKSLDLEQVIARQRRFVAERDWEKFHTPKNLVMALSRECSELLEIFQWIDGEESRSVTENPEVKAAVSDEIADVLFYLVRIADVLNIGLNDAVWQKWAKNEKKYPVDLCKGKSEKYTEYDPSKT
ncbi:MAG: nucleotide pyrophosphohydrolase [Oligoflexales bacterium]